MRIKTNIIRINLVKWEMNNFKIGLINKNKFLRFK